MMPSCCLIVGGDQTSEAFKISEDLGCRHNPRGPQGFSILYRRRAMQVAFNWCAMRANGGSCDDLHQRGCSPADTFAEYH